MYRYNFKLFFCFTITKMHLDIHNGCNLADNLYEYYDF